MKKYLWKYKFSFLITGVLCMIQGAMNVMMAFMLSNCIDSASSGSFTRFVEALAIYAIYILVMTGIDILQKIIKPMYIKKTMVYLKRDIFQHILKKDIRSFSDENSAKYISILTNDIGMIEADYIENIFNLIWQVTTFVLAMVSVVYINYKLAIAVFVMGIIGFYLPQRFRNLLSKRKEIYSSSLEILTAKTKDLLSGFEVIHNFNIAWKATELYDDINQDVELKKQKFSVTSGVINTLTNFFGTCMFILPMIVGGYFVYLGLITVGSLVALIQLMNNLAGPLSQSLQIMNRINSIGSITEKINRLTEEEPKQEYQYRLENFENDITLEHLGFGYSEEKRVLNDVSVRFEKGKKYALVGASGSGKSTLLRMLLRYYEPDEGAICIDGKPYSAVKLEDIHKELTFIQQSVFMFDGTLRENIGLYQNYSEEQIQKACNIAGLTELIESLPNGLDEKIGEAGNRLSGGQRQRVSIARALLRNSAFMLLDETTSALDNQISYGIERALCDVKDLTVVVVTHKLMEDILRRYDEIIVMKAGNIVEKGTYEELFNNKGYFYSLCNVEETYMAEQAAIVESC